MDMNNLPRKYLALFALVTMLGLGGGHAQAGGGFVTGIDGLPLMPELTEAKEEGMVFDSPSGRIVEAYAVGDVLRKKALEFYATSLPQLGWHRQSQTTYSREGEILRMVFSKTGSKLEVHFSLSPAATP